MADVLSRQIQSRANNSNRLSQLISATKGKQFEEHQENVNEIFNDNVNKYTSKVNEFVQERLQDHEEAVNAIMATPMAYSFGKKSTQNARYLYKNSDKIKTQVLDDIKKASKIKDDIAQKVSGKVSDLRQNLSDRVDSIRTSVSPNNTNIELQNNLLGAQESTETTESMAMGPQPARGLSRPIEENNHRNIDSENTQERNQTRVNQEREPTEDEIQPREQRPGEADGEVNAVSQEENTAVKTSESLGKKISKFLPGEGEEVEASFAIAPEIVGGVAGAAALGYGLYELFSHHDKRPIAPIRPSDVNAAVTTSYNLGSNILATSAQNLQAGSYSF